MRSIDFAFQTIGRVLAIAGLAFRSAVRSRLLIGMVALLLAMIIGLPATVRGDGTLAGDVRILLDYTLGLSLLVIGVAMLWTSCGAVANDMESGTLWLIMAKPVRPLELWLGRWFGLLALSAILIGLAGVGTYSLLSLHLHRRAQTTTDAERAALNADVLTGRHQVLPEPEDLTAAIDQRLEAYQQRGWDPHVIPRAKVHKLAEREVLAERSAVAPGGTRAWVFAVPQALPRTPQAALRIHIFTSAESADLRSGIWRVRAGEGTGTWQTAVLDDHQGVGHLALPSTLLQGGAPLRVQYTNTGVAGSGKTILFDLDTPVELLITESRFSPNLLRTLLVIGCQVGLLCAVGLAAGTFFHFPVAMFFASTIVMLALTGGYFMGTGSTDPLPTEVGMGPIWLQQISMHVLQGMNAIAGPAVGQAPLEKLTTGVLVSWGQVTTATALLLGLYGGTLALISTWFLHRREFAAHAD